MATPPEDGVEIINSTANSQVYETVASLEENEFRIFLEEVTNQDRKKADSAIAQAAQILLRKEEDALKEESGSGEDTQELLSACHKRKRLLKGKAHCDNSTSPSSAAARTSTGGSLGSLQDLTETKAPETSSAAGTKSGGSCGNLSRGSFKTQAPLKQRGKRLKLGRASASIREGGSLQNLSKTEVVSNEAKKLHKSGSLSQVFTDVGGVRLKNRRQKTSSESSGSRSGRKSEEKDVGSDGDSCEIPYRLLVTLPLPPSSHAKAAKEAANKTWNRDRMSDVASGESTEEDGESFHTVARNKLADATVSTSYANDMELMSVVTHTAHKDNGLHQLVADAEVDKKIKFCLGSATDNSLECGNSHISIVSPFFQVGQENGEKRYKNGKSENSEMIISLQRITGDKKTFDKVDEILPRDRHFNILQKTIQENQSTKLAESNLSVTINSLKTSYDDSTISHRSNGYSNGGSKEYNYFRMKAKCDKKKILKKKNEIPVEDTPGYVGDAPFSEILTFINDHNPNQKAKKKHKNKKEDSKDDKENTKRKKNGDRLTNNISALTKTAVLTEGPDADPRKKGKGSLRETSSVEDLVSKSKQNEADWFVRRQVTVDDGDVSPYRSKLEGKISTESTSEFSYDFYQVGDATLNDEVMQECGEFEVVNRKKSRKNRIVSTPSSEKVEAMATTGGGGNIANDGNASDNQKRCSPPVKGGRKPRPAMNFSEGLKFDGDVLFNKWPSNKGGSNCDRIGHTTSAPHSEGSDSDGDDSVHSMPVKSMTPKPEMPRQQPQSSDSTPQASYANIAKLSSGKKRLEKVRKACRDDSSLPELRKSRATNAPDFPPLTENSSPPVARDSKTADTNGIFSTSDLNTTSTKGRRNSVSNEFISKSTVVPNDVSSSPAKEHALTPSVQVLFNKSRSHVSNLHAAEPSLEDSLTSKPLPENSSASSKPQLGSNLASKPPFGNSPAFKPSLANSISCKLPLENNLPHKQSHRREAKVTGPGKSNSHPVRHSYKGTANSEPAVVFTDKASMSESVQDIEFGFGVSLEEMLPTPVTANNIDTTVLDSAPLEFAPPSQPQNGCRGDQKSVADVFRKLFVPPPKNEVFANHEALCNLFNKSWNNTLKMMEDDPDSVQVWKCPPRCDSPTIS